MTTATQLQNAFNSFSSILEHSIDFSGLSSAWSGTATQASSSSAIVVSFSDGGTFTISGQNLNQLSDGTFGSGSAPALTITRFSATGPNGTSLVLDLNATVSNFGGAVSASGTLTSFSLNGSYVGMTADFGGSSFTVSNDTPFGSVRLNSVSCWANSNGTGSAGADAQLTLTGNLQMSLGTDGAVSGGFTSIHLVANGQTTDASGFSVPTQYLSDGMSMSTVLAAMASGGGAQVVVGTSGNDTLNETSEGNTVDGGDGFNTFVMTESYGSGRFTVSRTSDGYTVTDTQGSVGTKALANIHRLQFADAKVALDMSGTQSGGKAAMLLGAVLGRTLAFANDPIKQTVMGNVIALFDDPQYSMQILAGALMRLNHDSLDIWSVLAGGNDATHIARYVLTTVNGQAPDQATLDAAVTAIINESGSVATQGDWLAGVASSAANQAQIDLVGLAQTGLIFH